MKQSFVRSFVRSFTERAKGAPALGMLVLSSTVVIECDTCQITLPEFDPPTADCEVPDPVFVAPDPCGGDRVFEALRVTDRRGEPAEAGRHFEVPRDGKLCLRVMSDRVAAATVALDGEVIIGPSQLGPHVTALRRVVEVTAGEHTVSVRVQGVAGQGPDDPKSTMTAPPTGKAGGLEVSAHFAAVEPTAEHVAAAGDMVELQRATCEEFNLFVDAFEPEDGELLVRIMRRAGMPLGRIQVLRSPYGVPRYLAPLPDEDLGLPEGASPEDAVRAWLERHSALMGVAVATTFDLRHVTADGTGNAIVVLNQHIEGLPVFRGGVVATVDGSGRVRRVQANVVPDEGRVEPPVVDETQAIALARAALGELQHEPPVEADLGIHDGSVDTLQPGTALAWRVFFPGIAAVLVDALHGRILAVEAQFDENMPNMHLERFRNPDDQRDGFDVVFSTREDALVDDCDDDPMCLELREYVQQTHEFFVLWGRDGFSDGKGKNGGEYHVRYGSSQPWFPCIPGLFCPERPSSMDSCYPVTGGEGSCGENRGLAWIDNEQLTLSTVSHEFGHGFLGDPDVWQRLNRGSQGYLGEHGSDIVATFSRALAQSGDEEPESPFLHQSARGPVLRDHRALTCDGYAFGACDARPMRMDRGFVVPAGCREHTHMDFLPYLEGGGEQHAMACVYSRIPYLLLQYDDSDGIVHRGVHVPGNHSFILGLLFFKRLLSNLPENGWDVWGYATSYSQAIVDTLARCAFAEGDDEGLQRAPECEAATADPAAAEQLVEDLRAPLWAQGFWSQELDRTLESGVPPTATVAGAAGDEPSGVYLLHTHPSTGALELSILTDPYTDVIGEGIAPTADLGTERLGTGPLMPAGAVAAHGDASGSLHVALINEATGRIQVIRRSAAGQWSLADTPFAAEPSRGLAIAEVDVQGERREIVVYAPPDSAELRFFFEGSATADGAIVGAGGAAVELEQPSLTRLDDGGSERWVLGYIARQGEAGGEVELRGWDGSLGSFPAVRPACSLPPHWFVLSEEEAAPFPFHWMEEQVLPYCLEGFLGCPVGSTCVCPEEQCAGPLDPDLPFATCEPRSCSIDADCPPGDEAELCDGGTRTFCVEGSCRAFRRTRVEVQPGRAHLSIAGDTTANGEMKVRVVAVTSRGSSLTSVPVRFGPGGFTTDDYRASRQVILAHEYRNGLSAVMVPDSSVDAELWPFPGPVGQSLFLFGLEDGGTTRVTHTFRRSE
jgi:hypothetical protein